MRRIGQFIAAAAAALLVPVAASTPASAAFECEVGYTAAESQNLCISKRDYVCSITSENTITVIGDTEQDSATGEADVSGNNSGGNAVTGEATNESGTRYTFTVTNSGSSNEDEPVCVAKRVIPAKTPEAPEAPGAPEAPEPGRGEAPAPVQPSQQVTPSALPVTSSGTAPAIFLVGGAALTAALVFAYRRLLL